MKSLEYLRRFEGLNDSEAIEKLADLLEDLGFTVETKKGKGGIRNFVYRKAEVPYIFVVIYKTYVEGYSFAFLDADVYDKIIVDKPEAILNTCIRHDKDNKIVFAKDKTNISVHRCVMDCEGYFINHKSHNLGLDTRELIQLCTPSQNKKDVKFYSQVDDINKSFDLVDSIKDLELKIKLRGVGYTFSKGRIYSPTFETTEEMYKALNDLEDMMFGEFRYNPLIDFSKTFYAYILCRCLGEFTMQDVMEYNRDYHIRNNPDIARYYMLAS